MGKPRIFFFPDLPGRSSKLRKYAGALGFDIVGMGDGVAPEECTHVFFWSYGAYTPVNVLTQVMHQVGLTTGADLTTGDLDVLNLGATDVRKSTVDIEQGRWLGRFATLSKKELATPGHIVVVKGQGQCTKDGVLMRGPIEKKQPGKIYMRLIDTRRQRGRHIRFVDLRLTVMGGVVVMGLRKWKDAVMKRGSWHGDLLESIGDEFEVEEIDAVNKMMQGMGISYAELDCLRDSDGHLYLIDINPTPGTMGGVWKAHHRNRWQAQYLDHFTHTYLQ